MPRFAASIVFGASASLALLSTATDVHAHQESGERDRPPAISAISERLRPFVDDREISGAVTHVATSDRIVHLDATGKADIGEGKPMRPDTILKKRINILMVQRANFPNSDASEVRRAFQEAANSALNSARWEKDIRAFEFDDKMSPPPPGAILFIGSSSTLLWKTLATDFPEHKVINRGFGGSAIADAAYYADRIVIPYKPRLIVLQAGSNDIAAGKTPEQVLADFKAFVQKVRARLPDTRIAFLSISPAPVRWAQADKQKRANLLIKEYILSGKDLDYIDLWDQFLGPDSKPREELFRDRLHNNAQGYKIRADVVRPHLRSVAEPPTKDTAFRPPAVPLVTSDPYLSVWSMADKLTDDTTRHWTRREHPLVSLIRVDGKTYRLMGKLPADVPPLPQVALHVFPTRSVYEFADAHVHVTLTFLTPALPEDLDVLARPLSYLTWGVRSVDGVAHDVSIYASASALLAVNAPVQMVEWSREKMDGLTVLRAGSVDQTLLQPAGDDTRIDWGYLYAAAPAAEARAAVGANDALLEAYAARGALPADDVAQIPGAANDRQLVLGFQFDLGKVGTAPVSRHLIIAYDEIYSIKFLGQKLRPYWRRNGASPSDLLQDAERDYGGLVRRWEEFDAELMRDLTRAGGARYAQIAALAYRQALAGCGLAADANKQPLFFAKENSSNGCIATVDVIYPAAPQFLLMGPAFAKALVAPALIYSTSSRWKFPFAPHDLGVYPQANGQVYGGGEGSTNEADMMPVEESANLILLCAAIAKMEGNAHFASAWWPQLTRWEAYLEKYGRDPENQLCTDDFMGHLAHNANLSVKAILAIAAYGELCRLRGEAAAAARYLSLARGYARHWMEAAADGDHSRIAFDKPNSWSQKYNLVWDKLLDLHVFPPEVARQEAIYYKKMIQRYGVPLDSRTRLTKTDWCLWSATLAEDRAGFEGMVSPIYDYLNATTARLPFVDSYTTDDSRSEGMRARPVIGGVFIKMLADPAVWKKWAERDRVKMGTFAPAPPPSRIIEVVPTSQRRPATWHYTVESPAADWARPGFDDRDWKQGPGGFGTNGTPGAVIGTTWSTPDIWLRREVTVPAGVDPSRLQLLVYHDEDTEIYIDGVHAARESGYLTSYQPVEISPAARELLKAGARVLLAVHCHQTEGGQGIDVGLVDVVEGSP